MKYPKYRLAFPGKHIWVFNGHPMTQFNGYKLNTTAIGNGVVSADKSRGYYGESATLYHDENEYTTFLGFSSTIGTIDGDTYVFGRGDDVVSGYFSAIDPYNPLGLPDYTIRLRYFDGVTPTFSSGTAVQVSQSPNIWDLTYISNRWNGLLEGDLDLIEVLGGNIDKVKQTRFIFRGCSSLYDVGCIKMRTSYDSDDLFNRCYSLSSVEGLETSALTSVMYMFKDTSIIEPPLFDTSNVVSFNSMFRDCNKMTGVPEYDYTSAKNLALMFQGCQSLSSIKINSLNGSLTSLNSTFNGCSSLRSLDYLNTENVTDIQFMCSECYSLNNIPLFDTSKVTSASWAFYDCFEVSAGALNLYNQMSTQQNIPTHTKTFHNCGANSETGSAELNQIPNAWK